MGKPGRLSLGGDHIFRIMLLTDVSNSEMLTLNIPRSDIFPTSMNMTPTHLHQGKMLSGP